MLFALCGVLYLIIIVFVDVVVVIYFFHQNKFNSEVMKPYTGHNATFEKLKVEVSLLPDPEMADKTFKQFEELAKRVEG